MRNVGLAAIIVGILLIILSLIGVVAQGNVRVGLIAAVIMIAVGWFLYRRKPLRP